MGPQTVLGLIKPEWEFIHFCVGGIMIFALIVHLFLNKKFLDAVVFCKKRILLVCFLSLGILLAIFLAFVPTKIDENGQTAGQGFGSGQGQGLGVGQEPQHMNMRGGR